MTHTSTISNIPYLDLKRITEMHLDELTQAVNDVVRSGWYLQGEATRRFENNYARYIGTRHCVGVANGLDSLTLTLRALIELGRIKPGDEVIVPANTFLATVLAVTENGLKPVFVDVDERTLCMTPEGIQPYLSDKTRAIMLVHIYGRCSCNKALLSFCRKNQLMIIEDNAQAHGCLYLSNKAEPASNTNSTCKADQNCCEDSTCKADSYCCDDSTCRKTGSIGLAGCHSFYPGKNLGAMGDGGAVTTDDDALADMIRTLANYGFSRKYVAQHQGRNSRLDEIQAAVLDTKLRFLDQDNNMRKHIARTYYNNMDNPLITLPQLLAKESNVYHIFPVFTPHRDKLQAWLTSIGIHTIIHYPIPPHLQECYPQFNHLHFPNAEKLANQELSLPLNPAMDTEEIICVIDGINNFKA